MEFEWDETKRHINIRDHKVDFVDAAGLFDGRPIFTYPRPGMMKTAGALDMRWTTANSIWWSGRNATGGRGLLPRIAPMTGKSEPIVHYTAEQLQAKRQGGGGGEGQTDIIRARTRPCSAVMLTPKPPCPLLGGKKP